MSEMFCRTRHHSSFKSGSFISMNPQEAVSTVLRMEEMVGVGGSRGGVEDIGSEDFCPAAHVRLFVQEESSFKLANENGSGGHLSTVLRRKGQGWLFATYAPTTCLHLWLLLGASGCRGEKRNFESKSLFQQKQISQEDVSTVLKMDGMAGAGGGRGGMGEA